MLLFAHTGIALGTAVVLNGLFGSHLDDETTKRTESSDKTSARSRLVETWVTSLGRRIDMRALLAGAVLSDVIDKPVGRLVYGTFGCRIFSHSLVFLLLIVYAGLLLHLRRRENWLLVLGFGVFTHLVLDEMWLDTQTLFWPVMGLSFPTVSYDYWEDVVFHGLFTSPKVYVPELAGLLILGWIAWFLVRQGKVSAFVWHGRIQG
jgi:inner membrane protein